MHQRQAGSYARRFYFGKKLDDVVAISELVPCVKSVGLIPPEFDDLDGGEHEQVEHVRASLTPP